MRKFITSACAMAIAAAVTVTGVAPSLALPVAPQVAAPNAASDIVQIRDRDGRNGKIWLRNRVNRGDMRGISRDFNRNYRQDYRQDVRRDFRRSGNYAFYNGHRGYRDYHRGYRRHNGFWFPAGAFIAGALITGAIANQDRPVYSGNSHVSWCYDRWRSYRAYDNTYQPTRGPRRECYSPYS